MRSLLHLFGVFSLLFFVRLTAQSFREVSRKKVKIYLEIKDKLEALTQCWANALFLRRTGSVDPMLSQCLVPIARQRLSAITVEVGQSTGGIIKE